MNRCFGCGYMWADLDEEGRPITREYCHYEGPDAWAPCEQDDYYAALEAEEAEVRAEMLGRHVSKTIIMPHLKLKRQKFVLKQRPPWKNMKHGLWSRLLPMKIIVVLLSIIMSLMIIKNFRKELSMEEYNPRTVQVWLDDSFMEIEFDQPKNWDEDKFYAEVVSYVLSNISVDIL